MEVFQPGRRLRRFRQERQSRATENGSRDEKGGAARHAESGHNGERAADEVQALVFPLTPRQRHWARVQYDFGTRGRVAGGDVTAHLSDPGHLKVAEPGG